MTFPDEFMAALGAWQNGWAEQAERRRELLAALLGATELLNGKPAAAFAVADVCYRKRFLVPNNEQNGGDMVPLLIGGTIDEGIASWTTSYDFARFIFKKDARPGTIGAIFRHVPTLAEVKLNIAALWTDPEFLDALASYKLRQGSQWHALHHFGNRQSEVILDAPLHEGELVALCVQIPDYKVLCEGLDVSSNEAEARVWSLFVERNWFPTNAYWVDDVALVREKIEATQAKFVQKLRALRS